ncbi:hypothetical protein CVD19_10095 [Bacillus sp. T33-2]|nr:hypothetical protein CVD19_10095 [Bacillus sp. T33-2]
MIIIEKLGKGFRNHHSRISESGANGQDEEKGASLDKMSLKFRRYNLKKPALLHFRQRLGWIPLSRNCFQGLQNMK